MMAHPMAMKVLDSLLAILFLWSIVLGVSVLVGARAHSTFGAESTNPTAQAYASGLESETNDDLDHQFKTMQLP